MAEKTKVVFQKVLTVLSVNNGKARIEVHSPIHGNVSKIDLVGEATGHVRVELPDCPSQLTLPDDSPDIFAKPEKEKLVAKSVAPVAKSATAESFGESLSMPAEIADPEKTTDLEKDVAEPEPSRDPSLTWVGKSVSEESKDTPPKKKKRGRPPNRVSVEE